MAKGKGKGLVIVESPAKARTLSNILGKEYEVKASVGHVRDLPKSRLGVDVDNDFEPRYIVPKDKKDVVKGLKEAAKKAGTIYLATDPDREGEAISWHLAEAMSLGDDKPYERVEFHEITADAVKAAFQHPRTINMEMVNAQQGRRVLDRLVGYKVSRVLWNKIRYGLSAGRVQSVALRMVVEREREIEAFQPQEYWTIETNLARQADPDTAAFPARLAGLPGTKKAEIGNGDLAVPPPARPGPPWTRCGTGEPWPVDERASSRLSISTRPWCAAMPVTSSRATAGSLVQTEATREPPPRAARRTASGRSLYPITEDTGPNASREWTSSASGSCQFSRTGAMNAPPSTTPVDPSADVTDGESSVP